jgi:hypothetical protein
VTVAAGCDTTAAPNALEMHQTLEEVNTWVCALTAVAAVLFAVLEAIALSPFYACNSRARRRRTF